MSAQRLLELLVQRVRSLGPLIVFDGSTSLPKTPQAVIERGSDAGRPVVVIHFVKSDGDGRPVTVALPDVDTENGEAARNR